MQRNTEEVSKAACSIVNWKAQAFGQLICSPISNSIPTVRCMQEDDRCLLGTARWRQQLDRDATAHVYPDRRDHKVFQDLAQQVLGVIIGIEVQ